MVAHRSADGRNTWLDSYLDQMLTRDTGILDARRNVQKMRRYFSALALSTAGIPLDKTLIDAADVNAKTGAAYESLFADMFVAEQIPAWTSNRLARLIRAPKRYIVDPALAVAASSLTAAGILNDPDLLGRTLDTFAMAQLRVEVALSPKRRRLHHLRTKEGRQEIDVIVELDDGKVLGIEFKASAAVTRRDAVHLEWLRDNLGERFRFGAVVHTGPDVFMLGDRIIAVPLCAMWG